MAFWSSIRLLRSGIGLRQLSFSKNLYKDPCSYFNNIKFFCSSSSSTTHIVHMRGLDWEAKEQDVIDFFKPLSITPTKIQLKCDISGRVTGFCEVHFATHAEAVVAMRKKNAFIGNRFIRLSLKSTAPSSEEEISQIDVDKTGVSQKHFIGKHLSDRVCAIGHFVRMRNFPTRMSEQAIYQFFWPLNVKPVSVQPVYDENGYRTGEFDVEFLSHEDAVKSMTKNNTQIGQKFVELVLYSDVQPVPRPPSTSENYSNAATNT